MAKVKVDLQEVRQVSGGLLFVKAQIGDAVFSFQTGLHHGESQKMLAEEAAKRYKKIYREELMTEPGKTITVDLKNIKEV